MTSTLHDKMHKEHRLWETEISQWRDDIAIWQKELADTEKDLARLKQAFEGRAETLRLHAATLRMLEQDSDAHEHALASFEQGDERGQGEALVKFAKKHVNESQSQEKSRESHETLKRHHHETMARWNLFVKTFVAGAER
jgi:hypothetical protein